MNENNKQDKFQWVKEIEITEFILRKTEGGHFKGWAKYFGLKQYPVLIRKQGDQYIVLIKKDPEQKRWKGIGKLFLYDKPITIRGKKEYKCIGIIKIRAKEDQEFHLVEDDGKYLGI